MNSLDLVILPRQKSSFTRGLSVQFGASGQPPDGTVQATWQANGTWLANLPVNPGVPTFLNLQPFGQKEPKPYDWINTSRVFTPSAGLVRAYTVEGMYGLSTVGLPSFAEPPSRIDLMEAAFGQPIMATGLFGPNELPHGVTAKGDSCYFVLHSPHSVLVNLVLADPDPSGQLIRRVVPMALTPDTLYWWCEVPLAEASPGKNYRFLLDDGQEVLDPAARQVVDRGDFTVSSSDDPNSPTSSWSQIMDVEVIRDVAMSVPWQTLGWEALLIYELHARRFIDLNPMGLTPLQIVADEVKPVNRAGNPGYLHDLPVTAIELMPIHEFQSGNPWGYNPAFFFAIDDFYGGSNGLAELVAGAHANGKGVILDLVYNHMYDSPLTQIAPDVYANGNLFGDRINNGHPMVKEFFRQATVYLVRTFGVDGYRFDDSLAIVQNQGGWDFLGSMRTAIRTAANALGRNWPYCVAENDPNGWDMSNPAWSIVDGRWYTEQNWDLNQIASNLWTAGNDNSATIKTEMDTPETWVRPFHEATRFAESHDSASDQQLGRVAARAPYGQGLQTAKAVGTLVLLSNGVPMIFCGQEVGDVTTFQYLNDVPAVNPQVHDLPPSLATDNTRVLAWFTSLMGLRNDSSKGLQGDNNLQSVKTGDRTIAFAGGFGGQQLFVVVTFGTKNQQQDSSWLGLPAGIAYKEIFNSSWPDFQVEFEAEQTNGGYAASIYSGQILQLPYIGAVILERR